MISKRDKLLNYPFQQQRFEQHREKVHSARPAIDFRAPPIYPHVMVKPKKIQFEKERLKRIEEENVRLLQKLGDIMNARTKRLDNTWLAPRPNFLSREKIFQTRPHTSNKGPNYTSSYEVCLKSPNSKTARRCPTCSGRPERTQIVIPEKRMPWTLPKNTINTRMIEEMRQKMRTCMHCGHVKRITEINN